MTMRRTVLVAGGCGFIGSHLCDALVNDECSVICVDNLSTGALANIEHLRDDPRFELIEHDVAEPLPRGLHPDAIFHLASPASPVGYSAMPIATLRANAIGSDHLLELARREGAIFLFASTSEVYGDPAVHPQPESYAGNVSPVGPRSMYDEAKRYAEALTMAFARCHGLDTRIVRIFNTYGPRMDAEDGRIVPSFMRQALRGEPLTIHGDGSQTRSLCYVSDLVRGLVAAVTEPRARRAVINLGNPEEHTVLGFADAVMRATGSRVPLHFVPHPIGDDPQRRCPDISRARALLDWEPRISLDTGLLRTCEWFREHDFVPGRHEMAAAG